MSCDWGTSSFRLRLVDAESMEILAEENTDTGIAVTYARWRELENRDQQKRLHFYLGVIREHIRKIEGAQNSSLTGVPLILSGMASSSIGMANLPYQELPFSIDGSDAGAAFFTESENFEYPVLLISGVKSEDDVMRGEETELIGSIMGQQEAMEESIYVFPGTHSKHIMVKERQLISFKTYMTGEYFELLSKKSILSAGIEKNQDAEDRNSLQSFQHGVQDAVGSNLLHTSFLVRTNDLFGKWSKKENFNYLSGLLIGTELQELLPLTTSRFYLCGSSRLKLWYEHAFQVLGMVDRLHALPSKWAEEAVIRGQFEIYKHFKSKR